MWAVSRALLEAQKCVYIHDWWFVFLLSLYHNPYIPHDLHHPSTSNEYLAFTLLCILPQPNRLSPELYMRRPSQEKYRLDNILKKIAERGVKIHVIVYNEVSNKTTPTDSQ